MTRYAKRSTGSGRKGKSWLIGPLVAWVAFYGVAAEPTVDNARSVPGAELFSNPSVLRLRLEISSANLSELRRDNRRYVPATVREAGASYQLVGVHLKGSIGSFRSIDDKPSFTLNFARFAAGQRFHGLRKIHLNNSAEDPSYLHERIGSEMFRAAGVPTPRVSWALVELNGRKLGLYVMKEGFAEEFLGVQFTNTTGNLYEGSGGDVNEPMPRESGSGPDDQADLQSLAAVVIEPDADARWRWLHETLDLDRFVSFMAVEVMIGHRDGYCLARNNYRIYHDPGTARFVFLPHGMDQLFGKADAPLQPQMAGLVADAVMRVPEGRRYYRERMGILLTNVFRVPSLCQQADRWAAQLQRALSRADTRALEREVAELKRRMTDRHRYLTAQLGAPEPSPLTFTNGFVILTNWLAVDPPAGGAMDRATAPDGKASLHVRAGPAAMTASWRCRVWLAPGRYRFEADIRTLRVEPLAFGNNRGAGLRVAGVASPHPYDLVGANGWQKRRCEFEVAHPAREMELICELRAGRGEAWFDLESLRLVQLR